ncbi:MAG: hypothetical protein ACOYMR_10555 [Ilumatobacteraceae bacterium]
MYLFTRQAVLGGDPAAAQQWAVRIGAHVTATCSTPIAVWAGEFGSPVGSVTWSAQVESLAGMSVFDPLGGDAAYAAMVTDGAAFSTGPHVATLRSPLTPPRAGDSPAIGSIATVTVAVAAGGKLAKAAEWGLAVSAHVEKITGEPISFMADAFGAFGQFTWIGVSADAAAADAANDKINADPAYLEMLDQAGGLFVDAMAHRSLSVRIG